MALLWPIQKLIGNSSHNCVTIVFLPSFRLDHDHQEKSKN